MGLICDRIALIQRGANPYFVRELETGYVVIGDFQHFKGYTLFLCKQHQTELFYLERNDKLKFLEEMSIVSEAVYRAFGADKMNCELLGNGDAHLHWHLFPRYNGDLAGYECGKKGGPVWWYPIEKMNSPEAKPSDDELDEMKNALSRELDRLLPVYQSQDCGKS